MNGNKPIDPTLKGDIPSLPKEDQTIAETNNSEQTEKKSAILFKQQRQLKIIEQLSKLFWCLLVLFIIFLFSSNIKNLIDRTNKFKGYGVEMEFDKKNIDKLGEGIDKSKDTNYINTFKYLGVRRQEQLINRVKLLQPILQTRTFKILWDDDHPINNIYVVKILELIGFKIETASTTEAGLELLNSTITDTSLKRYDLIISDYGRDNPGDKNGLQFVDAVKEIDYNIPVIFFSASYDEEKLGVPKYVYAVSHRADYLINYVLDVVERGDTPPFPR